MKMNRITKLSLLVPVYFIVTLYMTFKLISIDDALSFLYSFIVTIIFFLLFKKFEEKIKSFLRFKNNKVKVFSTKTTYWDIFGSLLLTMFLLNPIFIVTLNTISKETTYIKGVVIKKEKKSSYSNNYIKLKDNKTTYDIYPPDYDFRNIKLGKEYKIKFYKGWLGIRFYWKGDFEYRILK